MMALSPTRQENEPQAGAAKASAFDYEDQDDEENDAVGTDS
jgi:hypothetical protein